MSRLHQARSASPAIALLRRFLCCLRDQTHIHAWNHPSAPGVPSLTRRFAVWDGRRVGFRIGGRSGQWAIRHSDSKFRAKGDRELSPGCVEESGGWGTGHDVRRVRGAGGGGGPAQEEKEEALYQTEPGMQGAPVLLLEELLLQESRAWQVLRTEISTLLLTSTRRRSLPE